MLKINLMAPRTDWRKRLAVAFVSVSLVGLILLGLPLVTGHSVDPRPLRVEEQEILIGVTERLESRVPTLAPWLKDFRYSVTHNDFETLVRYRWFTRSIVTQSGRTLVFSTQFFEADSNRQEQSLLQVLVSLRSQIEPETDLAFGLE
jgi:hypothetical protein